MMNNIQHVRVLLSERYESVCHTLDEMSKQEVCYIATYKYTVALYTWQCSNLCVVCWGVRGGGEGHLRKARRGHGQSEWSAAATGHDTGQNDSLIYTEVDTYYTCDLSICLLHSVTYNTLIVAYSVEAGVKAAVCQLSTQLSLTKSLAKISAGSAKASVVEEHGGRVAQPLLDALEIRSRDFNSN